MKDINLIDNKYFVEEFFNSVRTGDIEAVKSLLDNGLVDVNAKSPSKYTGVLYAASRNDLNMIKLLLSYGAKPDVKESMNNENAFNRVLTKENNEIAKILIQANADISKGRYAEHLRKLAIKKNDNELLNLIDNAKPVEKIKTPKFVRNNNISYLDWLKINFKKGKKYNSSNNNVLCDAIKNNDLELFTLLIENGADPNLKNGLRQLPLVLAISENKFDMAELLIEAGADVNKDFLLYEVIGKNNYEGVKFLLEKGAKIEPNGKNFSALSKAIFTDKSFKIAQLLINNGANVNYLDNLTYCSGVIHEISEFDFLEGIKFLLDNGVNINLKNHKGWTPLHAAIDGNASKETIELLLQNDADINAKDNNGKTPLEFAEEKRRSEEIIEILYKYSKKNKI